MIEDPEEVQETEVIDSKTPEEVAKEVIAGHWGRGNNRKTRLEEAGYNPQEIQAEVAKLMNE